MAQNTRMRRRARNAELALVAQRTQIARMVLGEGGRIALVGTVVGIAGASAMGRFLSAFLFEVTAIDMPVFLAVATGLVGIALLACVTPARRAMTVDVTD